MSEVVIETERLRLILETTEEVLARIDAMSPADRAEVSPDWIARVRSSIAADPWTHGFRILETTSGAVVGSCAYKGPPDAEGSVEIAYEVRTQYRGRGYATEAAMALVDFAFKDSRVCLVRAHTQPETGASPQVLTKCGFDHVGEVIDPEDGWVWRWELHRSSA
ncbi:MAG TPA: GNAT family N-acetyltransferase [Pyrinomonadaceae bacterium]|nr:GNAT family N-acetyltransferase [Pyrinomonadaceae bacterium]